MTTAELATLGAALRTAGLQPRTLAAWAGTDRLSALPHRLAGLARPDPVPAAAALALFVGGAEVMIDRLRLPVEALVAAGLVERAGDRVRATCAVLPLGAGLLVCDRRDAGDARELVCWPDDSSHHLAGALPTGRRARWLDLGTGSAFAPLARPELATAIEGVDLNPRAIAFARLGVALTGIHHITLEEGDVGAPRSAADLVTCNAPIPDDDDAAMWRHADATFFARLWTAARACARPGAEIVVHARLAAIPDDLPGERRICVYTPPGARAFAVLWWRPDGPTQRLVAHRELTPARPHVDARDRGDHAT
jgi:hypothetical protein